MDLTASKSVDLTAHELDDIIYALDYTAEDLDYRCDQGDDYRDEENDVRHEIACLHSLAYRLASIMDPKTYPPEPVDR